MQGWSTFRYAKGSHTGTWPCCSSIGTSPWRGSEGSCQSSEPELPLLGSIIFMGMAAAACSLLVAAAAFFAAWPRRLLADFAPLISDAAGIVVAIRSISVSGANSSPRIAARCAGSWRVCQCLPKPPRFGERVLVLPRMPHLSGGLDHKRLLMFVFSDWTSWASYSLALTMEPMSNLFIGFTFTLEKPNCCSSGTDSIP